ncbi:DNA-binding protein [Dietzia aerolata]|uniref:DNA-binding protein n=1 Tax=Dietzia aerolata TaxID=595984 RepID=A0ABV5JSM1_9ACTN|nr:DNA-binding protein [Dietzia aerolata]MBB0969752.1 DNA-binding protein [Dietzia aerolata]
MTPEEIDALGVSTDLQTACRAIGISKSSGYAAAKAGTFPCRVVRIGSRYVVPTAGLRELLGMTDVAAA